MSRRTLSRRIGAAALLVAYLLPVFLPGSGALAHGFFHALIAHESAGHDEGHGHVHSEGGERHVHAPLVDVLLAASSQEDEVAPDPATRPVATASSHLAARSPSPDPDRLRESRPLRSGGRTLAEFLLDPDVPPPRV